MSKLCDQVVGVLKDIFPQAKIKLEEYVSFKGQKLYLDIFMPQFDIIIEVHGRQHDQFVEYFHGTEKGFRESKKRDSLKEEWASLNGYVFVVLREDQLPVTADSLLEAIDAACDG